MNPREKELMGSLRSYDKAPENFKPFLEFYTHANLYLGEPNKQLNILKVSDSGQGLLLGAEPPAGVQEGLSRTESYTEFFSYANPPICVL